MMKILLFALFILYSTTCISAIYMQKDSKGNVMYSDVPFDKNAEVITLPPSGSIQSSQPIPSPQTPDSLSSEESVSNSDVNKPKEVYTAFSIISPKDQDTFQNQPIIPVSMRLAPQLQKGDHVQLILDNKPWGKALPTTRIELVQIERGAHQLSAVVIDANQKIIKVSNTLTIFIHQATTTSIKKAA